MQKESTDQSQNPVHLQLQTQVMMNEEDVAKDYADERERWEIKKDQENDERVRWESKKGQEKYRRDNQSSKVASNILDSNKPELRFWETWGVKGNYFKDLVLLKVGSLIENIPSIKWGPKVIHHQNKRNKN